MIPSSFSPKQLSSFVLGHLRTGRSVPSSRVRILHPLLHALLAAVLLLVPACATLERNPPISAADPSHYLSELKILMQKEWPHNRTINIVCHGHSVPAGYFKTPCVDTFNSYPHLLHVQLKKRFPHAVINVVVTAIGGEDSESGARRFASDVLPLHPDLVLIDYSLNDRGLGLQRAANAWRSMISQASSQGAKVLLLTPTPDQAASITNPADLLARHAHQVRHLAAATGVGLVDSSSAFIDAVNHGRALPDLMSQVNHPNRAGHDLIVAEILKWFPE